MAQTQAEILLFADMMTGKKIDTRPSGIYQIAMMTGGKWGALRLTLAALFGLGALAGRTAAGEYVWPLADHHNITSGFCAYRSAHYHGGIDVSCGGTKGIGVRAVDSGYVYRISTSYWGYGKAVYLKLADGNIAVYGHLSDLSPDIDAYLEREQYSLRRYRTNLFPSPGQLPVRRGEIIGFTGQTGYGPVHLHFEIRDPENRPVNPLFFDFDRTDSQAPEIDGVVIRPLLEKDITSRVAASPFPRYIAVKQGSRNGHYRVVEPIVVQGPIGLAVDCSDPTGYKRYGTPPAELQLAVNNYRIFAMRYDTLDFALTRQLDWDYDFDWLATAGDYVTQLYTTEANRLPWYDWALGDGILDESRNDGVITPGANEVEISISDAAGNQAVLELVLVFDHPPTVDNVELVQRQGNWFVEADVADREGYVTSMTLSRSGNPDHSTEIIWRKEDSLDAERVGYILPTSLQPGELLTFAAYDQWDGEGRSFVTVPGGLESPLSGNRQQSIPLVGNFVRGGLVVNQATKEWSDKDGTVEIRLFAPSPLPERWQLVIIPGQIRNFFGEAFKGEIPLTPRYDKLVSQADYAVDWAQLPILHWPEDLTPLAARSTGRITSLDGAAWMEIAAGDLTQPAFFRIRPTGAPTKLTPRPTSLLYAFEPISVPFLNKVKIGISYADLTGHVDDLGLYALAPLEDEWRFLDREVDPAGQFMTAEVWSLGPFALIADTLKPRITRVRPGKGSKTSDRRPEITFLIIDDLSGIGSDTDIEILLDGEWLIPEYDPDTYVCRTRPRENLKPGKHTLEIFARDRVGHEDFFLRYFTVE